MKLVFFVVIHLLLAVTLRAQEAKAMNAIDLALSIGKSQGSLSGAFTRDWLLGQNKKIVVGVGGRFTGYLGRNQYYVTAPAKLTSGSTGLGVIFKENIVDNMDTLLIPKPSVLALNAFINLGYRFNEKFSMGFNIDAIGFSFGANRGGNYINGSTGGSANGKPTTFNLLLTSDNDLGSLNSELYAKYKLNERWSTRIGLSFLFTEYTTDTEIQTLPEPNDRFRNKALMFMVGTSIKLN